MRFAYQTRLSEHLAETPEGFLVCQAVPIARTGEMDYDPADVPVEAAPGQDVVRVEREATEVFDPETMASFEGKPVTLGHPGEDVTPANWKDLAVGHAQDVRRGEGVQDDLLLADLVITDQAAIALVRGGLREVSCGYDAQYQQLGPGRGRQTAIMGNHIALVPQGRCGPRCRINDNREDIMSTKKSKRSFADRLLDAFRSPEVRKALDTLDEAPEAKGCDEDPRDLPPAQGGDGDRLSALERQLAELAIEVRRLGQGGQDEETQDEDTPPEEETTDEDKDKGDQPSGPCADSKSRDARTRDAATVDADTKRRAEALVPGLLVADSDRRCAVQRVALRSAVRDKALDKVVQGVLRGSALDSCDCVTLDAAFLAASELAGARNNARTADSLTKASARDFGRAVTPADINAANEAYHNGGSK